MLNLAGSPQGVGVFVDLEGIALTEEERQLLCRPYVEGVILFGRNTQSAEQVKGLTEQIKAVNERLVISVDQEGGRVQRLREGVYRLPAAGQLYQRFKQNPKEGESLARVAGELLALELKQVGIDLSFAPVLDVDYGRTDVVGDRSFGSDHKSVLTLASAFAGGMAMAGMQAVLKHFPGHGWANGDTHLVAAKDDRSAEEIFEKDIKPFSELIRRGVFGVMPAHVVYPRIDSSPAGFSRYWLQDVLRGQLSFDGLIFSDDLSMEAAAAHGTYGERAEAAIFAGCNLLLACNDRPGLLAVLDQLDSLKAQPMVPGYVRSLSVATGSDMSANSESLSSGHLAIESRIHELSARLRSALL